MSKTKVIIEIIVTAIIVGFLCYQAGKGDAKRNSKEIELQNTVDAFRDSTTFYRGKLSEIEQNNEKRNKKLDEAIQAISNYKPIIKYEIYQNSNAINRLSDSTIQLYIDSIRKGTGFVQFLHPRN